jgi:hypothetical protein
MKTLAEQFRGSIEVVNFAPVAFEVARVINDKMQENTLVGRGFGNDEYNNVYSDQYAKRKKGGKLSPVTLRDEQYRIERAQIGLIGNNGAEITFPEFAEIFYYHHTGTATGGKTRSIFPKSEDSVPFEVHDLLPSSGR